MKVGRHIFWVLLLAELAGCQNPMQSAAFKNLEAETRDLAANIEKDQSADLPATPKSGLPLNDRGAVQTAYYQAGKETPKKAPPVILTIPPELLFGSKADPFKVPKDKAEFEKYVKKVYPPLPPLEPDLVLAPGPEGGPMNLADLQRLATQYNHSIRAAEQAVGAARGNLRQSMAYPNPTFAYEGDTVGTLQAGYQGFYMDQLIKTGNKLQLQGAAATMDLLNAQLALRRARLDVAYQVRTNYFAVLVALENVKLSRAFARFTDEIYTTQVKKMKGNVAAFYEPMQLRPLALQARFNLIQALNQYHASWRQLAVSLGLPDMPPSEVVGRVDMPTPVYDYQDVLQRMITQHTDVLTAQNNIHKNEYLLKLARVTPIPDVGIHLLVQKDFTTPPFLIAPSLGVSVALPVWDRNQGGIQQAEGLLQQAIHNLPVAQNNLINSLADAFNRYLTAKRQVEISLAQVIDQVRVYGRVYARHQAEPDQVTFGDIVTAQQTLGTYLTGYISALGLQWTAAVDVANLLQTDDLFKGTSGKQDPDVPGLEEIEGMMHYEEALESEIRSQESGVRNQESGVRSQKSGVKGQEPGNRNQETSVRISATAVKSQATDTRGQETGVLSQVVGVRKNQPSGAGNQETGGKGQKSDLSNQSVDQRFMQPVEVIMTTSAPGERPDGTVPFRMEDPLLSPPVERKSNQGAN